MQTRESDFKNMSLQPVYMNYRRKTSIRRQYALLAATILEDNVIRRRRGAIARVTRSHGHFDRSPTSHFTTHKMRAVINCVNEH